jgi:acetyl esterase/lipase
MTGQTHPPFDAELMSALDEMARRGVAPTPLVLAELERRRQLVDAGAISDSALQRRGAIDFEELKVPGPAGAPEVDLLVLRPAGLSRIRPAATVFYIHGGGMVTGTNRGTIGLVLDWVEELGLTVVSTSYRLAPEHPYPAPVEDCWAGLNWTVDHAVELGIDVNRLIIMGISAGGGLAAALTLRARDRGGPRLAGQLLLCPMLDDRSQTPSSRELDGEGVWDASSNIAGWTAFLGTDRGGPHVSGDAAPARAQSLRNLPPTFIDVGSAETFRDEDVEYAQRIWRDGGDCELHVWPGGFHSFDVLVPEAELSLRARAARLHWVRRILSARDR